MKLLLTSKGVSNGTIAKALEDLAGKPLNESKVVFLPTAATIYAGNKYWLIDEMYQMRQAAKSVDVLSLELEKANWLPRLHDADIIYAISWRRAVFTTS
jgi:peptidase E